MYDRTARTAGRIVEEGDESASLFTPGYLFAGQDVTQGGNPGFAASIPQGNPVDPEPSWVTAAPRSEPAPIASSEENDADSIWRNWTGAGPASIAIALPNGGDIRSLWVPVVSFPFSVSLGIAGAPMYSVTTTGGEIVPIPKGTNLVVLTANAQTLRNDLWVYVTADKFDPNKTGVNGAPLPISGQQSLYDKMILGTAGLEYYFPLSDALGALYAQDFGPQGAQGQPIGGVSFGGASLMNDGTSSAQFDGGLNSYLNLPAPIRPGTGIGNGGPWTAELWFNFAGLAQGPNNACHLLQAGNGTAGPFRVGILRGNSHLSIGTFDADKGAQTYVKQGIHYLAITLDAVYNCQYFLDGNLVFSSNSANDSGNFDSGKGCTVGGTGDNFLGNISKVAFYNRILTNSEIATRWSNHT